MGKALEATREIIDGPLPSVSYPRAVLIAECCSAMCCGFSGNDRIRSCTPLMPDSLSYINRRTCDTAVLTWDSPAPRCFCSLLVKPVFARPCRRATRTSNVCRVLPGKPKGNLPRRRIRRTHLSFDDFLAQHSTAAPCRLLSTTKWKPRVLRYRALRPWFWKTLITVFQWDRFFPTPTVPTFHSRSLENWIFFFLFSFSVGGNCTDEILPSTYIDT